MVSAHHAKHLSQSHQFVNVRVCVCVSLSLSLSLSLSPSIIQNRKLVDYNRRTLNVKYFFFCLPPGFLPVVRTTER